ncbi:MAG TPA: lysylphosphatidylglycerol synthase transmembrane domain-containing protein [Terriglobales bacterium]|jgi:uncharacterized membrane protein YbhN (UPF0104 family)|nr:lysylphosphatidylglycerol synthase transmembrane domain-containing protein [Terriglobales bacterium]
MSNRRTILAVAVLAALGALGYSQFRTWRAFDWSSFWQQTRGVNLWLIALGTTGIYLTYVLRAVRWSVFLRPLRKVPAAALIKPTFVGFAGVALLGRAGELVRPYLIARREKLQFPTQISIWAVERIFDVGAFAILLSLDILFSRQLHHLPHFNAIRDAGYALMGLTLVLGVSAFLVWRWTEAVALGLCRALSVVSPRLGALAQHKVREFGQGLHTMRSVGAFLEAFGLSLLIWTIIAMSYLAIAHSYPSETLAEAAVADSLRILPHQMRLSHVFPLIASSMAGSIVQLPAVGGGSQLAVITVLIAVFQVPKELAVSCGMLMWLVTFMAVVPPGLYLAHREHISLRTISRDTHADSTSAAEPAPLSRE